MVGRHADCCPIEATTCTHMHTCTSAMLARSGRRGGGLFDRAVCDYCRMLVEAKRGGSHAQSALRKARGGSAHDLGGSELRSSLLLRPARFTARRRDGRERQRREPGHGRGLEKSRLKRAHAPCQIASSFSAPPSSTAEGLRGVF